MDYDSLLREELGEQTVAAFTERLRGQGLDPADYYFMPSHPWQWFNKLSLAFAPMSPTARSCLGEGADQYLAQQSIRTFFNISQPAKRYVKTSLSILNMGFMRGLSPYYMSGTPAINEYIHGLIASDRGCARTASPFCARRHRWAFATTTTKPPSRWTRRTRRCSRRCGATTR